MSLCTNLPRPSAIALAACLLASVGAAQSALAGAHTLGQGATGASPEPMRYFADPPVLGQPTALIVEQGPPGAPGASLFAASLFESFQPLTLPGANPLYLDPLTMVVGLPLFTDPLGHAAQPLLIPPDPALAGQILATQAAILDPVNPFGAVFSNATLLDLGTEPPDQPPSFLVHSVPLQGPFLQQVMNSPETAQYQGALAGQGLGQMSFQQGLELIYEGDLGGPVPPDARFALVPVAGPSGTSSFYFYTAGTDGRGFREGAEIMQIVPQPSGGETVRLLMGPSLGTQVNLNLAASGRIGGVALSGTVTPYQQCVGICFGALIAAGTVSGLSAGCKAACVKCMTPPHVSCVVCAGCAAFVAGYAFGCWWGC
ncbi:MAG: hypothetical protein AAF628_13025 [Planctomycetota bacterium]